MLIKIPYPDCSCRKPEECHQQIVNYHQGSSGEGYSEDDQGRLGPTHPNCTAEQQKRRIPGSGLRPPDPRLLGALDNAPLLQLLNSERRRRRK